MGVFMAFLIVIEVFTSVLLVGVILLQKSKDEGLGLAFGAGVGETLFGSRAGNVLTKITIGLATVFIVNTLLIGYLMAGNVSHRSVTDRLPFENAAPAQAPAPAAGMPAPEAPAAGTESAPAAPAAMPEQPVAPAPAPAAPAPAAP